MKKRILVFFWILLIFSGILPGEELSEKAYELNRQGMIAMSEAKFEEAVDLFHQAAGLKKDYEISGKPLLYTPTFMAAWAYEKMGEWKKACEDFSFFLKGAGSEAEPTKKDHAAQFMKDRCR